MSKNLSIGKKDSTSTSTPPKERIIPIQIEDNEPKTQPSQVFTRFQSRKRELKENDVPVVSKNEESTTVSYAEALMASNSPYSSHSSVSTVAEDSDDLPERPVPPIYVPEKIIIILDRSLDDGFTYFELASGKKYTPLYMLQHAIRLFVHNKYTLSPEHEVALITLNENSATWVHDFTNLPQDIIASLTSINSCKPEDIFNLNSVFDEILEHVTLPNVEGIATPFAVRVVFLYNRSYSIPVLQETPEIVKLLNSPIFTFDVIMSHEPPDADNHCLRIFEILQKIDPKGYSYSFAVSRNCKELHIAMGKMLGHSLQRPPQDVLNYNITQFKY